MGKKRKESDSSEVTTLVKLSSACACLSLGIDDIQEDPVPAKKKKEKKQKTEDLSPKTNTVLKDSVNEGWQCHWKWHASRTSNGMFDDQQDSAEKKHKEKKHEKAVPLVHHRISFQSAQHPKSVCVCFPFRPTQVAELIKCVCIYIYVYTHLHCSFRRLVASVCKWVAFCPDPVSCKICKGKRRKEERQREKGEEGCSSPVQTFVAKQSLHGYLLVQGKRERKKQRRKEGHWSHSRVLRHCSSPSILQWMFRAGKKGEERAKGRQRAWGRCLQPSVLAVYGTGRLRHLSSHNSGNAAVGFRMSRRLEHLKIP